MIMLRASTRRVGVAAAVMLLLPAPSTAQIESQVPGCYDTHVGVWSPDGPGASSVYFMPPARVRLSLDSGRTFGDQPRDYAVETVAGAMPSVHEFSFWRVLGPDSVAVTWTTGFSGVSMRLAVGDTMIGTASTGTDVVPGERFFAEARAVRVDCDAPLPAARRAAYRYSPVVQLAAGDSLVLERVPAPGLLRPTEHDRIHEVRRGAAVEPYHGAHTIEVWTRADSTILSIRLHYGADANFDDPLQRLVAAYGDPTSGPRTTPRESAIWSDRTMYIGLARQPDSGSVMISIHSRRRHR